VIAASCYEPDLYLINRTFVGGLRISTQPMFGRFLFGAPQIIIIGCVCCDSDDFGLDFSMPSGGRRP